MTQGSRAAGLPVELRPLEAYLRREAEQPYLDPWYKHLSEAYKATMADLGVTAGLDAAAFLAAMETHKAADPGMAAVLSAIKSTVKGGIGKLRERPQGTKYRAGERWSAPERPTWSPDIRAAVISAARVNMHRKLVKTALATQRQPAPTGAVVFGEDALLPIALPSDCAVYLAAGRRASRHGHVPSRRLTRHGQARSHPRTVLGCGTPGAAAQPRPAHQGRRRAGRRRVGRGRHRRRTAPREREHRHEAPPEVRAGADAIPAEGGEGLHPLAGGPPRGRPAHGGAVRGGHAPAAAHRPAAPASSSCRPSPPKACRRSTSRTAAAAPKASKWSSRHRLRGAGLLMTAEPAPASEGEGEVDDPGFRHVGVEIICTPDVADAIAQQLRDAVEEIRASYSDAARGMWDAGSG